MRIDASRRERRQRQRAGAKFLERFGKLLQMLDGRLHPRRLGPERREASKDFRRLLGFGFAQQIECRAALSERARS